MKEDCRACRCACMRVAGTPRQCPSTVTSQTPVPAAASVLPPVHPRQQQLLLLCPRCPCPARRYRASCCCCGCGCLALTNTCGRLKVRRASSSSRSRRSSSSLWRTWRRAARRSRAQQGHQGAAGRSRSHSSEHGAGCKDSRPGHSMHSSATCVRSDTAPHLAGCVGDDGQCCQARLHVCPVGLQQRQRGQPLILWQQPQACGIGTSVKGGDAQE